jgi:hypothetical protein
MLGDHVLRETRVLAQLDEAAAERFAELAIGGRHGKLSRLEGRGLHDSGEIGGES